MDVSVIIPCHNRAELIGQTLDSALAQTVLPREVIVVDDGSTDATGQVVAGYAQRTGGRVRLVRQANAGPSAARNRGLEEATGEYLAFLDADDLWLADKLERCLAMLAADEEAVGVYCPLFRFRRTLDDLGRPVSQNSVDRPDFAHLLTTMCVQASTAVLRRERVAQMRFDDRDRPAEDSIYFAAARFAGQWRLIETPLVAYRVHGEQVTADPWHAVDHTRARVGWLGRHRSLVGEEEAQRLEATLWRRLIDGLEHMYWRRDTRHLRALCRRVSELCPAQFEQSFLAQRTIWPRWTYRLKDAVTRRR